MKRKIRVKPKAKTPVVVGMDFVADESRTVHYLSATKPEDPPSAALREGERARATKHSRSPFSITVEHDRDVHSRQEYFTVCLHSACNYTVGLPPFLCTSFSVTDEMRSGDSLEKVVAGRTRRVAQQFIDVAGAWPLLLALPRTAPERLPANSPVAMVWAAMLEEAQRHT